MAREKKERPPVERLAYSIEEFAQAMGLSRSHISNEIAAGTLKAKQVGRRKLIPVENAQAWIAQQKAAA